MNRILLSAFLLVLTLPFFISTQALAKSFAHYCECGTCSGGSFDELKDEEVNNYSTGYFESDLEPDIENEIDLSSGLENQSNNEKINKSIVSKSDFEEVFEDIEPTKAQSKNTQDSLKSDSQGRKGNSK